MTPENVGPYKSPPTEILNSLIAGGEQSESIEGDQDPDNSGTDDGGTNDQNLEAGEGGEDEGASKDTGGDTGEQEGTESDTGDDADEVAFQHEGKDFTKTRLAEILTEYAQNEEWKAKNTQRAQDLKAREKGIQGGTDLLKKIAADKDAVELLSDLGYDLTASGVESLLKDVAEAGEGEGDAGGSEGGESAGDDTGDGDRGDLEERMDELEGKQLFDDALNAFMGDEAHAKEYDTPEKVSKLVEFMVDKNILDFDEADNLLSAGNRATAADERIVTMEKEIKELKADPNAPLEGQGVDETVSDQKSVVHGDFGLEDARRKTEKLFEQSS